MNLFNPEDFKNENGEWCNPAVAHDIANAKLNAFYQQTSYVPIALMAKLEAEKNEWQTRCRQLEKFVQSCEERKT